MKKRFLLLLLSLVLAFSQLPLIEAYAEEYPPLIYDEMEDLQDIYDIADNIEPTSQLFDYLYKEESLDDKYYEISVEEEGYLFFVQYDSIAKGEIWWDSDSNRSLIINVYTGKSLTNVLNRSLILKEQNKAGKWRRIIYEAYYLFPGTYYVGAECQDQKNYGTSDELQESVLYSAFLASSKVFSVKDVAYKIPETGSAYAEVRFNYPSNNLKIIEAAPEVNARNESEMSGAIGGSYSKKSTHDNEDYLRITQNGVYTARYYPSTANVFTSKLPFYTHFTIDRIGNPIVPEKLTLSDSSITLKKGDTYKLTAEISPSDAIDQTLKWKSSSTKVCRVKKGVLTAKSEGTCKITVTTSNGIKKTCKVTVVAKDSGSDSKKSDASVKTTPKPTPKDKEDSKSSSTPEPTKSTETTPDPNGSGFYDQDIWDIDRIINVAIQEVGYIEKTKYDTDLYDKDSKNNDKKGKGNWVKYARDFDISVNYACNNDAANGHHPEWCSLFVWWCAYQAGLVDSGVFPAGKNQSGSQPIFSASYFPKNFDKVKNPQPGDIVWYDFDGDSSKTTYSHVGLIVEVDKNYIYTVEGNTTKGAGDKKCDYYHDFGSKVNSDAPAVVQAKARKKTYSSIGGYVRPKYGTYSTSGSSDLANPDTAKSEKIKKTDTSKAVTTVKSEFDTLLDKLFAPVSEMCVDYMIKMPNGFELKNLSSGLMLNLFHGEKKGGTDDGNKFDTYARDNSKTERFELIKASGGIQLRNYCSSDKRVDVKTNGRGVPAEGDEVCIYKPTGDGCSYWNINCVGISDEGIVINIESAKTPGLYIGHPNDDLDGTGRKGLVLNTDGRTSVNNLWYLYDPNGDGVKSLSTDGEKTDSSQSHGGSGRSADGPELPKVDSTLFGNGKSKGKSNYLKELEKLAEEAKKTEKEKKTNSGSNISEGVGLLGPDGGFNDTTLGVGAEATLLGDDSKTGKDAKVVPEKEKTDVEKIIEIAIEEIGYVEKNSKENLDKKNSSNNGYGGEKTGNWTKYIRDFINGMNVNDKNYHPEWCSLFIWWCAYKAGLVDKGVFPTGVDKKRNPQIFGASSFPKLFNEVNDPQPGDIVWYRKFAKQVKKDEEGNPVLNNKGEKQYEYIIDNDGNYEISSHYAHVGLIIKVDDKYIYTIEGNTTKGYGDKKSDKYFEFDSSVNDKDGAVVQAKAHKKSKKNRNGIIAGYCRPNYQN